MHHAPRSPDNLNSNAFKLAKKYKVYPVSSEPNEKTLFCNEGEGWSYLKTDKLGFRNSRETKKNETFAYLIGDSFAQGACVPEGDTFTGNLNKFLVKEEIFVKNLGGSGHNSIHYEMTLESFFPNKLTKELRPKFVILLIMENDFDLQDTENTLRAVKLIKPGKSYEIIDNHFQLTESAKLYLKNISNLKQKKRVHGLSVIKNSFKNLFTLNPLISKFLSKRNSVIQSQNKDSSYVIKTIENYSRKLNSLDIPLIIGFIPHGNYQSSQKDIYDDIEYKKFENYVKKMSKNKKLYFINFAKISKQSDYTLYGIGHFSKDGYLKYAKALYKNLLKINRVLDRNE